MIAYAEQQTSELIELLFKEEDRVTLAHIQELAARSDAVEPLREIIRNETYWYEGEFGEWWVTRHALTILSLMRAEAALPDIVAAIHHAVFGDNDWVTEQLAGMLVRFGPAAMPPVIESINKLRGRWQENYLYSFERSHAGTAIMRIALEYPETAPQACDFFCDCLNDPQEMDETFLALIADYPMMLDRERGEAAVRQAYARNAIDQQANGDEAAYFGSYDEYADVRERELTADFLEFYQPEEIARRQQRWKNERDAEIKRNLTGTRTQAEIERAREMAQFMEKVSVLPQDLRQLLLDDARSASEADEFADDFPDDEPDDFYQSEASPAVTAPAGYSQTDEGSFVREVKIGRNDPCPCLSGKKYKKCCGS